MKKDSNKALMEQIEPFIRRKWIIVLSALLIFPLSIGFALMLPKLYRSTTLILVEQQKVPEQYVQPTDVTPIGQRLNTISQQIMSRTNLESIIKDFKVDAKVEPGILKKILIKLGVSRDEGPVMESLIEKMKDHIDVSVHGNRRGSGDAFTISYIGKDPEVTKQITNALAAMFINENLKIREQYAEGTTEFIEGELGKAKQDLERQEETLSNFKRKHMGALPEQLNANLRTLDRLQLELQSVRDSLKNNKDRKVIIEEQGTLLLGNTGSHSSVATTGDALQQLNVELHSLKNELRSLLSVYKETYPDVIMIKDRIQKLEKQIEEETKKESLNRGKASRRNRSANTSLLDANSYNELQMVKSQIRSLINREQEIMTQIKGYEKRVEETPNNEQKLADLTRDYTMSFENYQQLLEKKLSARLAENLEKRQKGEKFRIVDPANLPQKPFKPNVLLIAAAGGFLGVALGIGIVFLLEFFNPAFRKSEDFDGLFDLPVLAQIPLFDDKPSKNKAKLKVVKGGKV